MKETISANVGGRAFTLDRDAYDRLSDYLSDVRNRVNDPTDEIMADIEAGIADIFSQTYTIDDNPYLPEAFKENLKKEIKAAEFF